MGADRRMDVVGRGEERRRRYGFGAGVVLFVAAAGRLNATACSRLHDSEKDDDQVRKLASKEDGVKCKWVDLLLLIKSSDSKAPEAPISYTLLCF